MKRLIPALIAATTLSATAHAGSINYDFRADFNSTDYNDEAGLSDFSKFYLKTGRVDFKGGLNEQITYRLRWAFNKPATAAGTATSASNYARDNTNGSVELAYLNDKMSDVFDLSLGKFYTEIGGWEGNTSGADLYLVSTSYSSAGSVNRAGLGQNAFTNDLLYNTGIKAGFTFADQVVYALITDNIGDANSGTGFDQSKGLMGAIWRGNFMDKMLGFYLSYHEVSPQTTTTTVHAKNDKHTFVGGGVRFDLKPTLLTVEYLATEYKTDAGPKDTINSIIAKYAFTGWETWIPRVEYTHSDEKVETGTAQKVKYDGVGLVLEYKPTSDIFRYHIAYNMLNQKSDLAGDDSNKSRGEIVVGTRIYGDFLK